MIEVKNLGKSFFQGKNRIEVIKEASFQLGSGESTAILGKSGSGKSTLLSLLAGLDRPDRGEITINQENLGNMSEAALSEFRAANIGIVFQQFHLLPHLTAHENVSLALEVASSRHKHSLSRIRELAASALESVGLSDRLDHLPARLSGGEQQRVALARSLIAKPRLLLADEPSGSLDRQTGEIVLDILFEQVHSSGTALILVTHDEELAQRCKYLWNLENGILITG
jgi:putative ABC transport system ATP-binding protein